MLLMDTQNNSGYLEIYKKTSCYGGYSKYFRLVRNLSKTSCYDGYSK